MPLKATLISYFIMSIYWKIYLFAGASLWSRHSWSTQFDLFIDILTHLLARVSETDIHGLLNSVYLLINLPIRWHTPLLFSWIC